MINFPRWQQAIKANPGAYNPAFIEAFHNPGSQPRIVGYAPVPPESKGYVVRSPVAASNDELLAMLNSGFAPAMPVNHQELDRYFRQGDLFRRYLPGEMSGY